MLRTDFLPRITNKPQLKGVFDNGRVVVEPSPPAGDAPTMPVEFSVAAYRLGHSMIRPAYEWNGVFEDGGGSARAAVHVLGDQRRARRRQPPAVELGRRLARPLHLPVRRAPTCSRGGTGGCGGTSPGASTPASPTRSPTCSRHDHRRGEPDGRAPQPGLPQPHPGADAAAGDRPADGRPHAVAGPQHQDPHAGADPQRRRQGGRPERPRTPPSERPREGHAAVVLRPPRGRAQQRAA